MFGSAKRKKKRIILLLFCSSFWFIPHRDNRHLTLLGLIFLVIRKIYPYLYTYYLGKDIIFFLLQEKLITSGACYRDILSTNTTTSLHVAIIPENVRNLG